MTTTEENSSILVDSNGGQVALKEVKVRARLHELVAEVEVEQSYVNPQNTNIETVYTFPLPIGAVLLGLELEIAGKKLSGQVIERKRAERLRRGGDRRQQCRLAARNWPRPLHRQYRQPDGP